MFYTYYWADHGFTTVMWIIVAKKILSVSYTTLRVSLYIQEVLKRSKIFKGSKRQTEAVKSKADAEGPNQQAASRNKPRQLLSKRRFVRESKDMKVVYAVIPKETLKLASDKSK